MSRTIFCLGARSHYENATSDLLKFFLNPEEDHGLGNLFMDCLGRVAALRGSYPAPVQVEREVPLDDEKRLDLLIESADSILAIENKHWASAYNPFALYEAFVRRRARETRRLHCDFILLCFEAPPLNTVPATWSVVTYASLLASLERATPHWTKPTDFVRWQVLSQEFLEHLRMEICEYDDETLAQFLSILRCDQRRWSQREIGKACAAIKLYVRARLTDRLGAEHIRVKAWSEADRGHGWSQANALDFELLENSSADIVLSLAIGYSAGEAIAKTQQLRLVAWNRAGATRGERRERLAARRRELLDNLQFAPLPSPTAIAYWEEGTAHEYVLEDCNLPNAMARLEEIFTQVASITDVSTF